MTSTPDATVRLPIRSDKDLAWVRHQVRKVSARLGFGLVQQTKLVTAVSELARNTLVHGGGGELDMAPVELGGTAGLRLTFTDHGPGIIDVQQALTDGFSTGSGLGLGLGGARRLVHEFTIDSRPGEGTAITVVFWAIEPPPPRGAVR